MTCDTQTSIDTHTRVLISKQLEMDESNFPILAGYQKQEKDLLP